MISTLPSWVLDVPGSSVMLPALKAEQGGE